MATDGGQTVRSLEDRPVPHSLEAERAVLGAILLDNAGLDVALQSVAAGDFFHDHHRRIFERMVEMFRAGKPIDLVTLTGELRQHRTLDSAGAARSNFA